LSLGVVAAALLPCGPALAQFGGPVAVRAAPVERRAWQVTQPLVAAVEAVTQTTLAAEQAGLVVERKFDEGSTVGKDQVLVRMDVELLKIQREAAEAARQSLAGMVEQAKVRAENSQREAERLRGLLSSRNTSDKEYRDALTTSRVDAAGVTVRSAEMSEKKAEVDRLDATIRKSVVRAPLGDGVVTRRYVEVGQWIKQGDPVADVVWLDPVFVRAYVPEYAIGKVKKGDEARVTFDALGDKAFTGTVDQIIPTADPNSRAFPVKILLRNPEKTIQPGFFARAAILAKGDEKQFVVPKDAVISGAEGSRVVAVRQGKAVFVPVTRGAAEGGKVAVTGQLEESDLVVTRGNENLRGGETLMVEGQPPPGAGPGGPGGPGGPAAQGGKG
jgi:RND family efflux transporter MFP subunit